MEIALPLLAFGSLFWVSNQSAAATSDSRTDPNDLHVTDAPLQGGQEAFQSLNQQLPNTDLPDVNFAPVVNSETQLTSQLSTTQAYDMPYAYTDKYFNPTSELAITNHKNDYGGKSFQSLTGDVVNAGYYLHNNMVPFFGRTVRGRFVDENSNEGVLDAMTGAGSQNIRKKEQSPLFTPGTNLHWTHGMPSATDFVQSRMNVSNKLTGVKPFEQIRVQPGLGKDTQNESFGYNSGMMARDAWLPKTVDELRTANKQKSSGHTLSGHEGPAMSRVTNRGIHAPVEKNRPDRVAQLDESRYFATLGASGSAATLRSENVDRNEEHRATTATSYIGAAGYVGADAPQVSGEFMPSRRMELGEVPLAPMDAVGHQGARDGDFGVRSMTSYTNNRSTSNHLGESYLGGLGGAFGAVVAPLLDVLRPSKRQNTIGSMRPYQNPERTVKTSYGVFNPDDKPAPTIREMTETGTGHAFLQASKDRTGYLSTGWDVANTNRQDTSVEYSGVAGSVMAKEPRQYDAEYRQRNNDLKSSTVAGRTPIGNTSLFQNELFNVRTKAQMENDLANHRATVPSRPALTPDASMMGRMTGAQTLYGSMQMDRMDPGVLEALQDNPYHMRSANGF